LSYGWEQLVEQRSGPGTTMSMALECGGDVTGVHPAAVPHPLREYLHWLLPLALLPLAFSLGRPDDDTPERFQKTLLEIPSEVRRQIEAVERQPDATIEDVLTVLPGRRIQGALLPRDTSRHWLFAALTAAVFFGLTAGLFPSAKSPPAALVGVGLFTATVGVVVMFAVQGLLSSTCRDVLDGDADFLVSLCGYVLGVGFIEEAAKALPLLWRVKQIGTPPWRTACQWGLASGVGFGVAESVYYAERSYNGLAAGDAYFVRFASCVALHAVWSASVGLGMVTVGRALEDPRDTAVYAVALLRVLAGPAALHGLYDVLLQYQFHAAALGVALFSFGWLAWQIESARANDFSLSPEGATVNSQG
jgi:RsiW-degrading membrane proteinase PrsW (M82 family)